MAGLSCFDAGNAITVRKIRTGRGGSVGLAGQQNEAANGHSGRFQAFSGDAGFDSLSRADMPAIEAIGGSCSRRVAGRIDRAHEKAV